MSQPQLIIHSQSAPNFPLSSTSITSGPFKGPFRALPGSFPGHFRVHLGPLSGHFRAPFLQSKTTHKKSQPTTIKQLTENNPPAHTPKNHLFPPSNAPIFHPLTFGPPLSIFPAMPALRLITVAVR